MSGPASLVAGRYALEHVLAEGGMGVVWRGRDVREERPVALKLIKSTGADEAGLRRFQREARAAMALSHPNIVRVHELVTDDEGAPVMVMELLDGESLARRLAFERRLDVSTCARIFVQVVSAIGTAHAAGIVHRDLKPDNVFLVGSRGGATDVRVLDFGVAKLTALEGEAAVTAALTGTGAMLGTPYYMSPEQVFGEKDIDHRADVWALGVILYECLSGRRPFEGENFGQVFKAITRGKFARLAEVAPHLPRDLLGLCDRMLVIERDERLSDLREVMAIATTYTDARAELFSAPTLPLAAISADAFAPTMASAPPPSREAPTPSAVVRDADTRPSAPPSRPRRARRVATLAIATALAVGLATFGVARWRSAPPPPGAAEGSTNAASAASSQSPAGAQPSGGRDLGASSPSTSASAGGASAPVAASTATVMGSAKTSASAAATPGARGGPGDARPGATLAAPTTAPEPPPAATTPPPAAPSKTGLAGGVADQPPF